jgi:hypothetical protein
MMSDLVVVLSVLGFAGSAAFSVWLLRSNIRLAEQIEDALHDKHLLQIACDDARDTFRRYAEIHLAKNTPEGDKKANSNTEMANRLTRVLKGTGYQELGPMQKALRTLAQRMKVAADGR